jgi:hypothetical protein
LCVGKKVVGAFSCIADAAHTVLVTEFIIGVTTSSVCKKRLILPLAWRMTCSPHCPCHGDLHGSYLTLVTAYLWCGHCKQLLLRQG